MTSISSRPGYKHTLLGWLPEDWEIVEIKSLATLMTNGFVGKATESYTLMGDGVLYIQGYNVEETRFNFTGVKYIDKKFHEKIGKSELREGDLLTIQTGDVGLTGIVTKDVEGANCHALIITRLKPDIVDPRFYHQYFNSEIGRRRLKVIETGSTMKHINVGDLVRWLVPTPPKSEQKKIAEVLTTWDAAIVKQQELIAKLRLRNNGLIQRLLTGKSRLNGFDNQEWRKLPANKIFRSVSTKNKPGEQLLSSTQSKGIIPRSMMEARVTMPAGNTASFKLVEKGDFVISLRSFQGGIEYSEYRGLVSPAYTVMKPSKEVNASFYKHYFKSNEFIGHLAVAVIGIRDGKQISYEDFGFLKLPYPEIEEQNAIAAVLDSAANEIRVYEKKIAFLKEQKKGLMQKLLTGEVRMKNYE